MDRQDRSDESAADSRDRNADTERVRGSDPSGDSIVDLVQQPIVTAWTTYLTLLFALIAVGFGIFGILRDAVGDQIIDTADGVSGIDAAFEAAFSIPLRATPYLGISIAVFVGAALGWRLQRDSSTTYVVAGTSTGIATAIFWVLGALFGSIPLDAVSLDIGGLLVNAVLAGIAAGTVAAGGVWATRTHAPRNPTSDSEGLRSEH